MFLSHFGPISKTAEKRLGILKGWEKAGKTQNSWEKAGLAGKWQAWNMSSNKLHILYTCIYIHIYIYHYLFFTILLYYLFVWLFFFRGLIVKLTSSWKTKLKLTGELVLMLSTDWTFILKRKQKSQDSQHRFVKKILIIILHPIGHPAPSSSCLQCSEMTTKSNPYF